jgi:hypothetical protein
MMSAITTQLAHISNCPMRLIAASAMSLNLLGVSAACLFIASSPWYGHNPL